MSLISKASLQNRSLLIDELKIDNSRNKKFCTRIADAISRIWRAVCERCRPGCYQKKLDKKCETVKQLVSQDRYTNKIEKYFNTYIKEAKEIAVAQLSSDPSEEKNEELQEIFKMKLTTTEAVNEFSYRVANCLGVPLEGKLQLLPDFYEWKTRMVQQRNQMMIQMNAAPAKGIAFYEQISRLLNNVKQLVSYQRQDVKSYSHFLSEFTNELSDKKLAEVNEIIENLAQEKSHLLEKYNTKKQSIESQIEKLKQKNNPSAYRQRILNENLKSINKKIETTESSFDELYSEFIKDINNLKLDLSDKSIRTPELLAYCKNKLTDLLKGKQHLDLVIETLVRFDRICLRSNLEPELNLHLKKALSDFEVNLEKLRENLNTPKYIQDRVSVLINTILLERRKNLKSISPSKSPSSKVSFKKPEEDKFTLELKGMGLNKKTVPADGNCLFHAVLEAIKPMDEVAPEVKTMDVLEFRKAVYDHMTANIENYSELIRLQLEDDMHDMAKAKDREFELKSSTIAEAMLPQYIHVREQFLKLKEDLGEDATLIGLWETRKELREQDLADLPETSRELIKTQFEKRKPIMENLNNWLITEGNESYLNAMGESKAYADMLEIGAIHDFIQVPIRVYSEKYDNNYLDAKGTYPEERSKAVHLLRPKNYPHYDALLLTAQNI